MRLGSGSIPSGPQPAVRERHEIEFRNEVFVIPHDVGQVVFVAARHVMVPERYPRDLFHCAIIGRGLRTDRDIIGCSFP